MTLKIVRNDIVKMDTDAIVCPTNNQLHMDGGLSASILKAAGSKLLLSDLNKLKTCQTGEAIITSGYKLLAKYIIFTVGPIWQGGSFNEEKLLYNSYINSLNLAYNNNLQSIAFPLISSGTFMFPKEKSLEIANRAINDFLLNHDLDVYLVVYGKEAFLLSEILFNNIKTYIDDKYVEKKALSIKYRYIQSIDIKEESLKSIIKNQAETFSQMLIRLIDESGLDDVKVYKRANIDRRLFSKIKSDKDYKPSKVTAIAFVIALNLNLDQTYDLLQRAGYALSPSSKFDLIIEYFIENKEYDIYKINEALFLFDQSLLGV